MHDGHVYAPASLPRAPELGACAVAAIVENSARLLDSVNPVQGLAALDSWLADLPRWPTLADGHRCARFAYEVIERRGTGGGGFRLLYAEFLDEAAQLDTRIDALDLAGQMRACAAAWTALAEQLRICSRQEQLELEPVRAALERLRGAERSYHERARTLA